MSGSDNLYDLWRNERWIGMSEGDTPAIARQNAEASLGKEGMANVVMTPFMGCGTSEATYTALMGKAPIK